jgi:hypothetical protein
MYQLFYVDLAGNERILEENETYEKTCGSFVKMRKAYPNAVFFITNMENVDVDCEDGFTDEERELHP